MTATVIQRCAAAASPAASVGGAPVFCNTAEVSRAVELVPRAEPYYVVPATWDPGTHGEFALEVAAADHAVSVVEVPFDRLPEPEPEPEPGPGDAGGGSCCLCAVPVPGKRASKKKAKKKQPAAAPAAPGMVSLTTGDLRAARDETVGLGDLYAGL